MRLDLLEKTAEDLEHFAEVRTQTVDGLPIDGFNMSAYYDPNSPCGAAACALGLIAARPWANALGFRLSVPFYLPEFHGRESFAAASALYEFSASDIALVPDGGGTLPIYLFGPDSYADNRNPALVAARIREVIAAYKAAHPEAE